MNQLVSAISLGANAADQGIRFALCLTVGIGAGIFALLYLHPARPLERALTDLFATLCIGGMFIICVEFILGGSLQLYGAVAYALGVSALPLLFSKLRKRLATSRKTNRETSDDSSNKNNEENRMKNKRRK